MDPISIIGAVAGIGLGLWSSSKQASAQRDMYNQQMAQLQAINTNQQATMPELPKAPTAPEETPGGTSGNAEADAEREKVLRAAAANNAMINPTGGRGLGGTPNMKKQTLGGA